MVQVCEVLKGDVIGMRLTPDRRGIQIVKEEEEEEEEVVVGGEGEAPRAAPPQAVAEEGKEGKEGREKEKRYRLRVLKTIPEVLSFPLKVMVVFGGTGYTVGPVRWLRGKNEAEDRTSRLKGHVPAQGAPLGAAADGGAVQRCRAKRASHFTPALTPTQALSPHQP